MVGDLIAKGKCRHHAYKALWVLFPGSHLLQFYIQTREFAAAHLIHYDTILFSVLCKCIVIKGHSCNVAELHMKFTGLFYFSDNDHKICMLSTVF